MSYKKALEILRTSDRKALIKEWYWRDDVGERGLGCAFGEIARLTGVVDHEDMDEEEVSITNLSCASTLLDYLDMSLEEADTLQHLNDMDQPSEEDRYAYMIEYLEDRVADEEEYTGKKYAKVVEALRKYEPRKLARMQYCHPDGYHCVIGALAVVFGHDPGKLEEGDSVYSQGNFDVSREYLEPLSLDQEGAWSIQLLCDDIIDATPEERYERLLILMDQY